MSSEKKVILFVDDEPINLELILTFLGTEYDVLYAANGVRGVQLTLEHLPDIIIMDWEMPEMNGIQAMMRLKENWQTADIPIIIATGIMTESSDLHTALEIGAVDFLSKPFNRTIFRARLRTALRLSDLYQQIKIQKAEIKELAEKEKRLLEGDLEIKTRELSSASLLELQKNELLAKLLDRLIRLDTVTNNMYAPEIKVISKEIKSLLGLEKSWSDFKIHFEKVNPEFFKKLSCACQKLTNNEYRICAYLKIGLCNKEIALLTNTESASVRRALNRLKKKLQISKENDLRAFIRNL